MNTKRRQSAPKDLSRKTRLESVFKVLALARVIRISSCTHLKTFD